MSREALEKVLDQIHSDRDEQAPLERRIPNYIKGAVEAAKTPGTRTRAIDFVSLAVKAKATVGFKSVVETLEKNEQKIVDGIESAGDQIVAILNRISGAKS